MDRSQDAFVKLAHKLPSLSDPDDVGGWLHRVAVNTCLKSIRKQKGWTARLASLWNAPAETHASTVDGKPAAAVAQQQSTQQLRESLTKLPAKTQAVITLIYLEEMPQNEVATTLGYSKGYVSKLHAKGLEALRHDGWEFDA